MIEPFDSSFSAVEWMERNCFRCSKYDFEVVRPDICNIDEALTLYAVGGEPVSDAILRRAGRPGDKCLEFEHIEPNLS